MTETVSHGDITHVINRETICGDSFVIRYAYDNNKSGRNLITSFTVPLEFSIKLLMSFRVELIGFSLALGTDDIVTGNRSIVVPTGQFVRVTQRHPSAKLHASALFKALIDHR